MMIVIEKEESIVHYTFFRSELFPYKLMYHTLIYKYARVTFGAMGALNML